ncbi:MAG: ATP-binding protein [Methylacidiphilales bacterium]|nr:ATP-binding protein [Candidatus Methylacidiphilales bacterium]
MGPESVAFLGGFARQLQRHGCEVSFEWGSLMPAIKSNLIQNGFLHAFGSPHKPRSGNSVPYREDWQQDSTGYVRYLDTLWLGRNWVRVSEALRGAVTSRLAEAYLNVFEHAQSEVGLFCCGQHFPKKRQLRLAFVDFGVGIPNNVRRYSKETFNIPPSRLPAKNCLEWAFKKGTSTKTGGRGLGLDLIQSFVQVNNGMLEMYSHEGYAQTTKNGLCFDSRTVYFEGTLVSILLKCDGNSYKLASETDPIY